MDRHRNNQRFVANLRSRLLKSRKNTAPQSVPGLLKHSTLE
jgi:hypothetical protein